MRKAQILIIFPLVLSSGIFSGCTGLKKPNAAAPAAQASSAMAGLAKPSVASNGCTLPSAFTIDSHAQSISVSSLSKMTGNFSLSSANLYSLSKVPQAAATAVSVEATIKVGANGLRDTRLQRLCDQLPAGKGYTETLPLIMTLHLPSLRVTEFDAGEKEDIQATNNPSEAALVLDSQGDLSLKNAFSEKGPYSTGLSLNDWISKLPSSPSVVLLADGSLEMRIHWVEKNITTEGYLHFEAQK